MWKYVINLLGLFALSDWSVTDDIGFGLANVLFLCITHELMWIINKLGETDLSY